MARRPVALGDECSLNNPDAQLYAGYVLAGQGYELITCPNLPGPSSIIVESINNSGVVSGGWIGPDGISHGLLAYPSVVLPTASVHGAFVFDVAVIPNAPVFLGPAIAVGYRYAVGTGDPLFASVTLPIGTGDSMYTLIVSGIALTLSGGQRFDFAANGFPGGVAAFEVLGIEPAAQLDPTNPTAFVTEVTFGAGGDGRFTGSMVPMTVGDELEDLGEAVAGVEHGMALVEKVRQAQAAYASGDVPATCESLDELVDKLGGNSVRKMGRTLAQAAAAEARAIEDALGCR